jgi:hypothetical protein
MNETKQDNDTCLKDCCNAAVEAYKQEVAQNEKLNESQKGKWFVRGLAVILLVELVYLRRGDWNFINILFSVVALLCWVDVLVDVCKWAIKKEVPSGLK